ncbi:hypothetical protein ACJX0J_038160, partial [Zea mays]
AIGITNYRETIVIWSKSTSYPLCDAIVWMDARTSPVCRRLENELSGDRTHFVETCGLPISTYFSAMKLLWLMENVVAMLLLLYRLRKPFFWYHILVYLGQSNPKLGIGLLVLQNLSGINGVLFYASSIFKAAGVTNSDLATCSLGAIEVLATGVTTWLLDRAGRHTLLIITISTSGITLCLLVVSVVFFLKDNISEDSNSYYILTMISLVGIVSFVITFSFGMGAIPWLMMSE